MASPIEWFEKLPTSGKIAVGVGALGLVMLVWQPWKKSASTVQVMGTVTPDPNAGIADGMPLGSTTQDTGNNVTGGESIGNNGDTNNGNGQQLGVGGSHSNANSGVGNVPASVPTILNTPQAVETLPKSTTPAQVKQLVNAGVVTDRTPSGAVIAGQSYKAVVNVAGGLNEAGKGFVQGSYPTGSQTFVPTPKSTKPTLSLVPKASKPIPLAIMRIERSHAI